MRDRTAMTGPLTIGQQLVARWEGVNSGWSEPADLAEAIDKAIEEARIAAIEQAAHVSRHIWFDAQDTEWDRGVNSAKRAIADAILSLKTNVG